MAVAQFEVLTGARLRLRPVIEADYALYASLYGDNNILRYIGPALEEQALQKSFEIALRLSHKTPCKRSFLVAELIDASDCAGILGLTVTEADKIIEVGIIFREAFQKQHLAYEALQILITFLCNKYTEYDIIAQVDSANRAAVWLAKKLGFRYNQQTGLFELNKLNKPLWGK